jgi:Fungal specific transcription factor domain
LATFSSATDSLLDAPLTDYFTATTTTTSHAQSTAPQVTGVGGTSGPAYNPIQVSFISSSSGRDHLSNALTRPLTSSSLTPDTSSPPSSTLSPEHQFTETAVQGASHWRNTFDRFDRLRFLQGNQNEFSVDDKDLYSILERYRELENSFKHESVSLERPDRPLSPFTSRGLVPARSTCDVLVELYMNTFESVIRILHVPSFLQDYRLYWKDPQRRSESFVWKLLLAMAIGTFFCKESMDQYSSLQSQASTWISCGQQWLVRRMTENPQPDIDTLQIIGLFFWTHHTTQVGKEPVWLSEDCLIRMAMKLGLHQEPRTHFPNMSVRESEIRRRLWAGLLEISIQASFDSGLPPLITPESFDCEAPSNIADTDIEGLEEQSLSKPLNVFTQSTVQILLSKTQRIRLRILHLVNAPGTSLTYQDALQMTTELNGACNSNLALMQSFLTVSTPGGAKPTEFQIKLLDIYTRRFLLPLHSPFADQAKTNPSYYYSRKVRMEASALLLSYPLSTQDLEQTPAPDHHDHYAQLRAFGEGIFINILQQATSAMCLDLTDDLQENAFPVTDRDCRKRLYKAVLDSITVFEQRVRATQSTMKEYIFFACAAAQIRSMQAGWPVDREIARAAKASLELCCTALENAADRGRSCPPAYMAQTSSESSQPQPATRFLSTDEDFTFWDDLIVPPSPPSFAC